MNRIVFLLCFILIPQVSLAFTYPSTWTSYLAQDLKKAKDPKYASRIEVTDLSKPTVIFFHGIHDSVPQYDGMRSYFSDFNWVRVRLSGHYDKTQAIHNSSSLEWLQQSRNILNLITEVTGPVYVIGHSLGGLLAVNLGIEYPNKIKGVIVASPALGLSPIVSEVVKLHEKNAIPPELMSFLDDLFRKNKEQLSPAAGLQVKILGKKLLPETKKQSLYKNMKVPLFLINVTNDIAISSEEVEFLENNYGGPLFFHRKVGLKQGYNHPSFQNVEKNVKLELYPRMKVFIKAIESYL